MRKPKIEMTKDQFKAIRKELGMTQAEFAKEIGVINQGRISDLESGRVNISGSVAAATRLLKKIRLDL